MLRSQPPPPPWPFPESAAAAAAAYAPGTWTFVAPLGMPPAGAPPSGESPPAAAAGQREDEEAGELQLSDAWREKPAAGQWEDEEAGELQLSDAWREKLAATYARLGGRTVAAKPASKSAKRKAARQAARQAEGKRKQTLPEGSEGALCGRFGPAAGMAILRSAAVLNARFDAASRAARPAVWPP